MRIRHSWKLHTTSSTRCSIPRHLFRIIYTRGWVSRRVGKHQTLLIFQNLLFFLDNLKKENEIHTRKCLLSFQCVLPSFQSSSNGRHHKLSYILLKIFWHKEVNINVYFVSLLRIFNGILYYSETI